jgi:hypothetical protein
MLFLNLYFNLFSEAIETCPSESTDELSQFYQNRAATWESLVSMNFYFCSQNSIFLL